MSVPAERTARPLPGPRPAVPERHRSGVSGSAPSAIRRRRKHHVGFAVLSTALVAPMLLGIVSLNALLAQTSFRIDEAERRIEELQKEHVDLVREQAALSAPGRIADWARRNGMRLPDDIRSLHASGGRSSAPAGAADTSSPGGADA